MEWLYFFILIALGYFTGQFFERTHYSQIKNREKQLNKIPIITSRWQDVIEQNEEGRLYSGDVVISSDYFKTCISMLRFIFGGRVREYESLLDRARREAILRMKEKAARWGAEKIINLRLEQAAIYGRGGGQRYLPIIEVLAYGTAVKKMQDTAQKVKAVNK